MNNTTLLYIIKRLFLLIILLISLSTNGAVVGIISSYDVKPYQQTIDSFKASVKQAHPDVEFFQFDPERNKSNLNPTVIFALGSKAVQESINKLPDRSLLATMILDKKEVSKHSNNTTVILMVSQEEQLKWHRRILPKAKKIGILYDPQLNQEWVDIAKVTAAKLDLEIIDIPIHSARDIPPALKSLSHKVDSILGIADTTVYSGATAKAVLLFSFRNRIPFVGLSNTWVKSGALYALDWDYSELGKQCADTALKILDGTDANKIEPQLANKTIYIINKKTADHMKIEIDDKIISGASRIYK
ncbi:MAG: hypothetical protein OEY87_00170 [Gammaproteobacteria bacterium]|nr:hypothetical protein [Gammaproteobacteria bacterium]MDH5734507.1 hypothetical protein [Gammaproteobacteria bacterium]